MLTPLVSSTGGAFTNVYPASDVLCRRLGTVSETSGSHYPLANSDCHSLARARFRSCIDPCGQNRACAERFKNSAAHDPEHLPSYQGRARFYPCARYHPLGCPREAGDTAYPFTLPLCRDAPSRAPRSRSSYAEPTRAFRQTSPLDQRYVRSTTAIPHVKNKHSLSRVVTESLTRVAPGALR
jgi:hypothetical protein